jgi:hypothetical protein
MSICEKLQMKKTILHGFQPVTRLEMVQNALSTAEFPNSIIGNCLYRTNDYRSTILCMDHQQQIG